MRSAEKEYLSNLKRAEKALGGAERDYEKRISAAEKELGRVKNPPPLGKYGSITLHEDRLETSSGAIGLFDGPVTTDVQASGNVVVKKDKKIDTRQLHLTIRGPARVHAEKANPDHETAIRELAAKIESASGRAEKQRQLRREGIARAETALAEARQDRSGIEETTRELERVRAEKTELDARRSAAGLAPLPDQYFTRRRRVRRVLAIAALAVVVLLAAGIGIAAVSEESTDETPSEAVLESADSTSDVATSSAGNDSNSIGDASSGSSETVEQGSEGSAVAANAGDTGRMSEGEYDWFTALDDKLLREVSRWTDGYATCAQIGLAGDLAGFRDSIQEAWDGFEGAVFAAHDNAKELLSDTAKECRRTVRAYMRASEALWGRNSLAHEAADSLDFEAMTATFQRLPKVARRYSDASLATRDGCSPT